MPLKEALSHVGAALTEPLAFGLNGIELGVLGIAAYWGIKAVMGKSRSKMKQVMGDIL